MLDEVIHNRTGTFTFDKGEIRLLFILAQLVIGIALVGALGAYAGELWLKRAGERIAHDLRVRTYAHLQRLSLGFHDKRHKGDLVTRLTEDANAVGDLFSDAIGSMAQAVLLLGGIATISIMLDPWLAVVLLVVTPILGLVTGYFRKRVRLAARAQRAHEGQIASLASESLSAIRVVKALGGEVYENDRVAVSSEERRRHGVRVAGLEARFSATVEVIGAITMAIVLVVGAFRVSAGAVTAGSLVVFVQVLEPALPTAQGHRALFDQGGARDGPRRTHRGCAERGRHASGSARRVFRSAGRGAPGLRARQLRL